MIVERFRPEHLEALVVQDAQAFMRPIFSNPKYAQDIAKMESYTAFIDGRPVAIAGILPIWEGRAECWAIIAQDIGRAGMRKFHRAALAFLDASPLRRMEAFCDANFVQAHRWLLMLGFEYEGAARKYSPDGRDCLRFARVKS